jgi:hypothetical protein
MPSAQRGSANGSGLDCGGRRARLRGGRALRLRLGRGAGAGAGARRCRGCGDRFGHGRDGGLDRGRRGGRRRRDGHRRHRQRRGHGLPLTQDQKPRAERDRGEPHADGQGGASRLLRMHRDGLSHRGATGPGARRPSSTPLAASSVCPRATTSGAPARVTFTETRRSAGGRLRGPARTKRREALGIERGREHAHDAIDGQLRPRRRVGREGDGELGHVAKTRVAVLLEATQHHGLEPLGHAHAQRAQRRRAEQHLVVDAEGRFPFERRPARDQHVQDHPRGTRCRCARPRPWPMPSVRAP